MAVNRDYMLRKARGPSAIHMFVDKWIVPPVVNTLWDIEVALDRAAQGIGVRPAVVAGGVAGILSLSALVLLRRALVTADT